MNEHRQESTVWAADLLGLFARSLRRLWWLCLVLIVLCTALFGGYARLSYRAQYTASMTFLVNAGGTAQSGTGTATAAQMAKTFPYILTSGLLDSAVRDRARVMQVFDRYRPDLVCHAAAHKHVPLMETSPFEAIKNNVFGTYNVAQAADRFGTQRFILISTDKAVNPTNVMGASKRLCEMIVQMINDRSATEYVAVRFGNVLGSAGSVIPLFRKQIRSGGPVTVTDKRVIRYFMTIPEAVQLIFQAGAYARGGEIFVLDMGEPVRIDDLARNMIRLSGFEPDVDIPIVYTGLRPGEKLYEELLLSGEGMQKTKNDLIYIGHEIAFDPAAFEENLMLLRAIPESDEPALRAKLRELVPTFHAPDGQTLPQNAAVG